MGFLLLFRSFLCDITRRFSRCVEHRGQFGVWFLYYLTPYHAIFPFVGMVSSSFILQLVFKGVLWDVLHCWFLFDCVVFDVS